MKSSETKACQILVVDDEISVAKAIEMMLKFDGHEVQTVTNGAAALALLEQGSFDLVITDYVMPGMKGDQLAALIKKQWPDQRIIMVSAFADEFTTYGKPSGGVDLVVNKPFSLAELRDAIVRVAP